MKYWWGSFSLNRTRVAATGKVMLMTTTIRRLQNQTPVAHMIASSSSSLLPLQSFLYNQHYLTLSIVTSLVNIIITTGWPASATASSPFGSTLYGDADECWQLYYVSPHRCLMTLFAYQASIRPHCRILNNNREEMQVRLFSCWRTQGFIVDSV